MKVKVITGQTEVFEEQMNAFLTKPGVRINDVQTHATLMALPPYPGYPEDYHAIIFFEEEEVTE